MCFVLLKDNQISIRLLLYQDNIIIFSYLYRSSSVLFSGVRYVSGGIYEVILTISNI